MAIRTFSADAEVCARDCFENCVSDEPFTIDPGGPQGAGTLARRITMASGAKAWVKPGRIQPGDGLCAAHEKIASDLARMLGLPVPPVALSRRGAEHGLPAQVAISYEVLPQGRPWGQMAGVLTAQAIAEIQPAMAAMWPFHAWIVDGDHNWNNGNVLVEIDQDGSAAVAFIDYSFSLLKGWNPPAPPPVYAWDQPKGPYLPCTAPMQLETVAKIENISSTDFDMLLQRIPEDFMPVVQRESLRQVLFARRLELRKLLKLEGTIQ